jgi:hypothetical protein
MDLTPFVDGLRRDLLAAADAAGDSARAAAERLTGALDASVRLALLDALAVAAEEITAELAPGTVDVRLRGREPQFVVTMPAALDPPEAPPPPEPPLPPDADDGVTARISLRLPDSLKGRIEEVANSVGVSVNAWLVRALNDALTDLHHDRARHGAGRRRGARVGSSLSGWAR